MKPSGRPTIYGLMAEFESSTALVDAARRAHHEGYRKMDAYSPVPIEELHDALHMHDERLPKMVMIGGILGGLGGYGLQYWASTIAYPLNVGGRPLHSWPTFIPVTFETTILAAALTTVLGMLALNGLPLPRRDGPRGGFNRAVFWTDERTTIPYDLWVIAILAFVWLTPPDWLGDPTATGPGLIGWLRNLV